MPAFSQGRFSMEPKTAQECEYGPFEPARMTILGEARKPVWRIFAPAPTEAPQATVAGPPMPKTRPIDRETSSKLKKRRISKLEVQKGCGGRKKQRLNAEGETGNKGIAMAPRRIPCNSGRTSAMNHPTARNRTACGKLSVLRISQIRQNWHGMPNPVRNGERLSRMHGICDSIETKQIRDKKSTAGIKPAARKAPGQ